MSCLEHVYDPELGVNIVDLGLVYGVQVQDEGRVKVQMTLTTPGCPMHDMMTRSVERAAEELPGVSSVMVEVVWEPAWSPQMMSDKAKAQLGMA
ncbi:hypothetical protein DNH61_13780 [Paenibacillus sambharensis]|uniref:MIP18 family-like domain-containing protein n=2 Tax=Paenibacillus sambharensis TaxID=1803190 RepID=A0A2W1LA24_9BACL|nr:hypothetical protein DNH61_13780 [Paenibacillus sambharensis]